MKFKNYVIVKLNREIEINFRSFVIFMEYKLFIIMWGPIDPICSNCIGKGWAQYPVSYVQTTLERTGPNTQSEDKRVSEDDQ